MQRKWKDRERERERNVWWTGSTTNARPLFVLWLSNQLKTDIEYWCDERIHSQTMKSNRETSRRRRKNIEHANRHIVSAVHKTELKTEEPTMMKKKPFLIICHNIYFCLVEWSRRISGIRCIRVCMEEKIGMIQQQGRTKDNSRFGVGVSFTLFKVDKERERDRTHVRWI